MALGKNVLILRTARGWEQVELSSRSGVPNKTISAIEKRDSVRSVHAAKLAAAFGVTLNDLVERDLSMKGELERVSGRSNTMPGPDIQGTAPLISWVQAGYGVSAVDNLHPGEGERIETTYKVRRHTYALRVRGDSMEPKFPQGCIVIVEPEDDPIHGKFVIVRRNGDEPTLKQYIEEGGTKFLKPVNPRYPIEVMREDDVFCGVVKRLEMDV